jgi:hypothetical protein
MKHLFRGTIATALMFFILVRPTPARACVYATDIRVNGSLRAGILLPGGTATISYILNDTATGGVTVQILYGTNVIQTLNSADGAAGTNAGLNFAIWDGTTDMVTNLAEGAYSVSITAASSGYNGWTNITDDGTNFAVAQPRGIAVNRNTNSPFYGRVYAGNAYPVGGNTPNAQVGIYKFNADGSPADEGTFSTGGWGWSGGHDSPWKMAIGADDRLYVDDFSSQGVVVSFGPTMSSNSLRQVIRADNYPTEYPNLELSGLSVIGSGTNEEIWMTDESPSDSAGVIGWQLASGGVAATNDTGTVILPLDANYLTQAPYDLSLDSKGFIYTIQFLRTAAPAYALMSFPPYGGVSETTADWATALYPETMDAYGVAVDATGTYVALAAVGPCDSESACGGLYLFNAANGEFIANLDKTGGDAYYDVAWDNVGNLYALDGGSSVRPAVWRAYSPPRANQATTVASPVIQVYDAILPPYLSNVVTDPDWVHFTLTGQSNIDYVIQQSGDLVNWVSVGTNYGAGATRCVSVPIYGSQNFYRAMAAP